MSAFRARFIVAALVTALSFPALAEQPVPDEGQALKRCDDGQKLRAYLQDEHGEDRVMYATDSRGNLVEVYVNPLSQSWSILLTTPSIGITCMIGAGQGVEIFWPPVRGTNA